MRVTIHQPQFLPWLGYLDKIDQADVFVALDTVQFKKNEWQNRNRIRTAAGWQWLTVPVRHRFGQRVADVRIDQTSHWRGRHLRALAIHYAKAPNRERYWDELCALYRRPWERLVDLNLEIVRWLMRAFGITTPIRLASEWNLREEPTDRLIDICRAVGAKYYLCGTGADAYLDRARFEASGVELEMQRFRHPIYRQCYEPFVPGLSAIDLLFACGDSALAHLRAARSPSDEASPAARHAGERKQG
ncbi:MAG TPA: WbqC family protein [Chloroflexota bacterium]|nr:WbqC family protein [Chloroflexota bacterium]